MKIEKNGSNVYYIIDDRKSFIEKNSTFNEEINTDYTNIFNACDNKCLVAKGIINNNLTYIIIIINDLFFIFDLVKLDENRANKAIIFAWFEKTITENFGFTAFLKIRSEIFKAMFNYS